MSTMQRERARSHSSSSAGTVTHDGDREVTRINRSGDDDLDDLGKLLHPDDLEAGGAGGEDDGLMPKDAHQSAPKPKPSSSKSAVAWMVINTLATIGIVFTNKAIFSDPSLKLVQLSFACFHFFVTWLTLYVLSRPSVALFAPRRAALRDIAPLAVAMALNVVLPNLSLAFSSVTFYQLARILLTPAVALLNYLLHGATLPRAAVAALVPACLGVGAVSYYDSLPAAAIGPSSVGGGGAEEAAVAAAVAVKTTTVLGVVFALAGVLASSLYTVWIAAYHRRLNMSSMQLLLNQAPVAAVLLLYAIPFADSFPASWADVPAPRWVLILASGALASLINMSQFFIVAQTGPVSSTVVGHVKTCTIVALGWAASGRAIGDRSVLGVIVAIGGIIWYSIIMLKEKAKQAAVQGFQEKK